MIMTKKLGPIFFLFFLLIIPLRGQIFDDAIFERKAEGHYLQGRFANVDQSFALSENPNTIFRQQQWVDYYKMVAALRLNDPAAEKLIENYRLNYDNPALLQTVYFDLANYYFNNQKYAYAHKWFAKVSASDLPKASLPQFYFNKGYTLFTKKQYAPAKALLENVKNHPQYESDAHYYLGHIAYQLDDYSAASNSFSRVSKKDQHSDLGYFQVEMNFKLGRFEKAIALGEEEIQKSQGVSFSELSKILGESYFNTQQYQKAIPHLKNYQGKNKQWLHEDFYQLGYAYYEVGDYSAAINQFSKIIGKKDKLAQNAYYYLAECYLKKERKPSALNAYRSAAAMTFNPDITQTALLNYARLSYEIGNPYEKVPQVIIRYLEQYPKTQYEDELTALLLSSYTNSGDYEGVIDLLTSNGDYKDDRLLQKVTYLKAVQLFQAGDYTAAETSFQQALKNDKNNSITAQSQFWLAQTHFELNRFEDAADGYFAFENNNSNAALIHLLEYHYHLGYVYFKLGDYELALTAFEKVIQNQKHYSRSKVRDAYLRMGDSEFALSHFWPAMEHYNQAISLSPAQSDYALYQKAISYGFVDRIPQKISSLESLIEKHPTSAYLDDAHFELSSAYAVANAFDTAISNYDRLISRFPKSPHRPRAILNKGLILYNQEKLEQAQQVLRELVIYNTNDAASQQALGTLKEIAIDLDQVPQFTAWLKQHNIASFSANELEKTAYAAAEKQFLSNRKKQAKKSFLSYLTSYPEGQNALQAHFALAEIALEEGLTAEALAHYQTLIDQSPNEFLEQALVRATQILVKENRKEEALPLWKQLEAMAVQPENRRYAMFNLMRSYHQSSAYSEAIQKAEQVLALDHLAVKVKWDAYEVLAHAALAMADSLKAEKAYAVLEKSPIQPLAAEAYYFKAHRLHKAQQFQASNEVIAALSQKFSSQPYWAAKSLLLMAQNFYALDDAFQATYILESLVENYQQFDEIKTEGQALLEKIKSEQAQQNASLSQQNSAQDND